MMMRILRTSNITYKYKIKKIIISIFNKDLSHYSTSSQLIQREPITTTSNKYGMIDREDNLTPTVYLRELFHDTFSVLSTQHEWLHTNRNIAYIQLLISDRLYSYLEHVQHHANFKNLIDNVREYRPSMNNEDIVNSLQVYLFNVSNTLVVVVYYRTITILVHH